MAVNSPHSDSASTRSGSSFVQRYGEAVIPSEPKGFVPWWLGMFPDLPPRLANECIWLAVEKGLV